MNEDINDMLKDLGFSNDDLEEDTCETEIDKAKLLILDQMYVYLEKTREAVKYHEPQNENANFKILSRYVSAMIDIQCLDNEEITDDEKIEKIHQIEYSVKDLSFEDSINFSKYDEEEIISGEEIINKFIEKQEQIDKQNKNQDDGSDTDW